MRTTWRATAPDGIAHAFVGSLPHALCGVRNQPQKFDWPTRTRCASCSVEMREVQKKAS